MGVCDRTKCLTGHLLDNNDRKQESVQCMIAQKDAITETGDTVYRGINHSEAIFRQHILQHDIFPKMRINRDKK